MKLPPDHPIRSALEKNLQDISGHTGGPDVLTTNSPCVKAAKVLKSINVASFNTRGKAKSHSAELADLLQTKSLDVLGLQEVLTAEVSIPGYTWFGQKVRGGASFERSTKQGIGFLVRNSLKTLFSVALNDKEHEVMWLKMVGKGNINDTYFALVYCPCESSYSVDIRRSWYTNLSEHCLKFNAKGDVILLGDFNARVGDIVGDTTSNSNGTLLLELLRLSFGDGGDDGYSCLVNNTHGCHGKATREESGRSSIIDYFISAKSSVSRIEKMSINRMRQEDGANALDSDHHLLQIVYTMRFEHAETSQCTRIVWDRAGLAVAEKRDKYQAALKPRLELWQQNFTTLTSHAEFNELLNSTQQLLLDAMYEHLNLQITVALSQAITAKRVSPQSRTWWDEELRDLTSLRTSAHAKLKEHEVMLREHSTPFTEDASWTELMAKYTSLRRELQSLIAAKQKESWLHKMRTLEDEYTRDQRHFFAEIARLRGNKKTEPLHSLRTSSDPDSRITSDPVELRSILYDYHSQLCTQEDPADPNFNALFYHQIRNKIDLIADAQVGPPVCESPIQLKEIESVVASLANFKANGLDAIMNESLKYGGALMTKTLHTLFSFMWQSELSPAIWAKASVCLLFKGGDKDPLLPQAYRPISLTSSVSKVYESILLGRAVEQSDNTNTLPEEQGGFRKQRSCFDQNFILRELINSRSAQKINTYICYVDFENAFPSAWRAAIWYRLQEAGIQGKLFRVIRSLYADIESTLITPYGLTDWYKIDNGTRQGAVLSPFLFSIIISPTGRRTKGTRVRGFLQRDASPLPFIRG